MFDEVYEKLAGKSVYFDTSFILQDTGKERFCALIEKHGADKILFGTDSPWTDVKKQVDILSDFVPNEEIRKQIFSQNALRLLKGEQFNDK